MSHKYLAALAVSVVFSGCAVASNVVPLPEGKYEVSSVGESKEDALKNALDSATSTCKPQKKHPIVLSQSDSYKGAVSEATNKNIDKAADVLANATQSWIPTLSNEDDYQTKITFTCEQ